MFVLPAIFSGGMQQSLNRGDVIIGYEQLPPATDTTNTALAVTAAMMLYPVYVRNPAGVSTDTYPTAQALITAMRVLFNGPGVPAGSAFRWRVINLSANLITGAVTANTGATMTRGNVLASSWKDFLIKITNGTPARTVANITSVNGSAVLTGFGTADLQNLSVGMVVTNAIVNLQGQTIIGINLAAGSVTMSGNANADSATNSIDFSPTYSIVGLAA